MSGFFSRNKTLAGAQRANLNTGGIYFEEGTYLVEVTSVSMKEIRNGEAFIVETTVLESTNPARPAGMSVSWFVGFKVPEASERERVRASGREASAHPERRRRDTRSGPMRTRRALPFAPCRTPLPCPVSVPVEVYQARGLASSL